MNNALSLIKISLIGTSITFKPVEKGKDRPVQTMFFRDLTMGQYGLVIDTVISYKTKNSSTTTTVSRLLSLARVMEYVAQAAEQTYVDEEIQPTEGVVTETVVTEKPAEEIPAEEPTISYEDWQKPAVEPYTKKRKGQK